MNLMKGSSFKVYAMLKSAVAGEMACRGGDFRAGGVLRDLPVSFFHGPVSASFFHRKRKVPRFMNTIFFFRKTDARAIFKNNPEL
ncbi:MAG: hypothetical protein EA344_06460 [Alkalicoccus sp.]|nr:MAG: hypothetical protein EA344_06460 [Alkalicoccus sp.]